MFTFFFFFIKLKFEICSEESASEMRACSQGPSSSRLIPEHLGYLLGCDFGAFTVMSELTPEHVRVFPAHMGFPPPGTFQPKHPCPLPPSSFPLYPLTWWMSGFLRVTSVWALDLCSQAAGWARDGGGGTCRHHVHWNKGGRRSRNGFELTITSLQRHFYALNAPTCVLWLWFHNHSLPQVLALEPYTWWCHESTEEENFLKVYSVQGWHCHLVQSSRSPVGGYHFLVRKLRPRDFERSAGVVDPDLSSGLGPIKVAPPPVCMKSDHHSLGRPKPGTWLSLQTKETRKKV